jgi:hypothetical protein
VGYDTSGAEVGRYENVRFTKGYEAFVIEVERFILDWKSMAVMTLM